MSNVDFNIFGLLSILPYTKLWLQAAAKTNKYRYGNRETRKRYFTLCFSVPALFYDTQIMYTQFQRTRLPRKNSFLLATSHGFYQEILTTRKQNKHILWVGLWTGDQRSFFCGRCLFVHFWRCVLVKYGLCLQIACFESCC